MIAIRPLNLVAEKSTREVDFFNAIPIYKEKHRLTNVGASV